MPYIVIAADTIGSLDGLTLGKPLACQQHIGDQCPVYYARSV